jgi:hypothetical protein
MIQRTAPSAAILRLQTVSRAPTEVVPFRNAEEAWFWFICSVEAREAGATPSKSKGNVPRPCEPVDIYRVLERLYRNRRLRFEHMKVLSHFGRRRMPPEARRPHEAKSHQLWREAMKELDASLQRRGVVRSIFKPTEIL